MGLQSITRIKTLRWNRKLGKSITLIGPAGVGSWKPGIKGVTW
jgi:hypothetical protein